ncbi:unnamed protein product [marine sediment metagenome]|uniref:RNA polymerase sigma-70 region 2 domain-containing protein n=1 Tax=marine sediment metagenome TaxID=412755 RepID=X1JCB8_9ZZZZ
MELDMHKEVTDEQILKFRPLVKNIAYKFKNSGEPLEDLEQLGYIGLINAINLYNQQRKVKFETYASWFISGWEFLLPGACLLYNDGFHQI